MSATDPMFDESDLDVPDYYCVHGTFLGNPYGADYMCGWCEDGISYDEFVEHKKYQHMRKMKEQILATLWGDIFDLTRTYACIPTGGTRGDRWAEIFEAWIKPERDALMAEDDYDAVLQMWSLT